MIVKEEEEECMEKSDDDAYSCRTYICSEHVSQIINDDDRR